MIIADLPCLVLISDHDEIIGGKQNFTYDNRAAAVATTQADGVNVVAAAGTSVYLDRGFSKAESFSVAKSLG
jgi:hypothetical protein